MVLNGVSKTYAMTGWRIGYCGGGGHHHGDGKRQSNLNPASISQVAPGTAVNGSNLASNSGWRNYRRATGR